MVAPATSTNFMGMKPQLLVEASKATGSVRFYETAFGAQLQIAGSTFHVSAFSDDFAAAKNMGIKCVLCLEIEMLICQVLDFLRMLFICIYVAGFAWSWGPLGWLVPSEIFPLEIRSAAQSVNVSVNMLFTFLVAQVFLNMLCHLKFGLFLFFAFFVLVMSFFIYFFLPETKGIPIEEMGRV
ncbi:hypothetical protein KPL70_012166 [Citrus sinensis]|nr:hypothetical protein KPL70_012166 [Citrus sinensis]